MNCVVGLLLSWFVLSSLASEFNKNENFKSEDKYHRINQEELTNNEERTVCENEDNTEGLNKDYCNKKMEDISVVEVDEDIKAEDEEKGSKGQDISTGKPVKIVDVKEGKFQLNEEALRNILMQPDVKDEPVMVLSIVGTLRRGKSFLLNLLIKYLSFISSPDWIADKDMFNEIECSAEPIYTWLWNKVTGGRKCSPNWMDDKDSKLSGFEWAGGPNPVTTGIWMWSKLLPIRGFDGEKMWVAFVDTQGTSDSTATSNVDSILFGLNAALSSLQIYNAASDINESDMRFLELAVSHGLAIKNSTTQFQTLMFLIRDWPHPTTHSFGKQGGKERLEKLQGEEKNSRQVISSGYKNLTCFLLPSPGQKVERGQSDGSFKSMNEDFLEHVHELAKMIFSPNFSKPLQVDGNNKTCGDFFQLVKNYTNNIENVQFPEVDSPAEANAKKFNLEVRENLLVKCDGKLKEGSCPKYSTEVTALDNDYHTNIEDIFEGIMRETLEEFEQTCKYLKSKKYEIIFKSLKNSLQMKFQSYKTIMDFRRANADNHNYHEYRKALESLKSELNNVCLSFNEPKDLETWYNKHKKKAIQDYNQTTDTFGPSSEVYLLQLKTKLEMERQACFQKMTTYNEALEKYKEEMDRLYSKYQNPDNFAFIHERVRGIAMKFYKEEIGKTMSEEDLNIFETNIKIKRKDCEEDMIDRIDNAKKKNDAEHNRALLYYRNEMVEDCLYLTGLFDRMHKQLKISTQVMYNERSTKGFPSYEPNLEDLQSAVETLRGILANEKSWYNEYIFRHFYKLFNMCTLVVPRYLLKNF